jgi:hypothetical protein
MKKKKRLSISKVGKGLHLWFKRGEKLDSWVCHKKAVFT